MVERHVVGTFYHQRSRRLANLLRTKTMVGMYLLLFSVSKSRKNEWPAISLRLLQGGGILQTDSMWDINKGREILFLSGYGDSAEWPAVKKQCTRLGVFIQYMDTYTTSWLFKLKHLVHKDGTHSQVGWGKNEWDNCEFDFRINPSYPYTTSTRRIRSSPLDQELHSVVTERREESRFVKSL